MRRCENCGHDTPLYIARIANEYDSHLIKLARCYYLSHTEPQSHEKPFRQATILLNVEISLKRLYD